MANTASVDFDTLKEELKGKGYKLAPQGRAIIDTIIQNKGRHLTVEGIYDKVEKSCPEVGLATVYKTVILLEEMGVVYKLDLEDGCSRYEPIHSDEGHRHHHLVCNKCGRVSEVEANSLDELEGEIETKYGFETLDHVARFFGICKDCKNE